MKRGEIWTVSGGSETATKLRPVVIVQDDSFDATASVTVCAFINDETEAPLFRLDILPNVRNGLRHESRLMVDKITTVSKSRLRSQIGQLDAADLVRLNEAMLVFLGLALVPGARTRS